MRSLPVTYVLFLILSLSGCSLLKRLNVQGVRPKAPAYVVHLNRDLEPDHNTGNLPISFLSPLTYEGILYVADARGVIQAVNLSDGRSLWEFDDKTPLGPRPGLFKDQLLYGSLQGRVFSRHYLTGELKYVVDLGASIESPPTFHQGRAFFHLRDHRLVALDAETGKILWSYKRSVPYTTTIHRASTPVVFQNRLYVGMADGFLAAFSIEDGILLWERRLSTGSKFVDVDTTPVIVHDQLWAGSFGGDLMVLDPKSGEALRTYNYIVGRTPYVLQDQLLVGTTSGMVVRIEKNLNVSLEKQVANKAITNIVLWKNYLVVSTTGKMIYFLDPITLETRDTLSLGGSFSAIYGEIDVTQDYLSFVSSRNRLFVLR